MLRFRCRRGNLTRGRRIEVRSMNNDIPVLHAIAGLHARSGGPSRVVVNVTNALAQTDNLSVTLLTQSKSGDDGIASNAVGVNRVVAESSSTWKLALGLPFRGALRGIIKTNRPALLHNHGLWLPLNHWVSSLCRKHCIPVIVQPHGMLMPWALDHKAWKKQLAMVLYQRHDLSTARLLVATAPSEYENLRAFGLRQPIAIIPNGVSFSVPDTTKPPIKSAEKKRRTVLFLGRIYPVKGLINLIDAWAQTSVDGWRLKIAGPDEGGHLADVLTRVQQAGLTDSVEYVGAVDGDAKSQLFRSADLFVLPSFTENFGVVVAEALAHGVPVITTRGAPWQDLRTYKCGWWIDIGVEPLASALRAAMKLTDADRQAMGLRGRDYVRRYDWDDIAAQTVDVYRWVLGQGDKPDCVQIN